MEVSFIIANYNGIRTLDNCLKSILKQNYPKSRFEIIVVDDSSTDNSWRIAKKYRGIKLIRNKKNLRFCRTNNVGIKKSSGKYIAFINNDVTLSKNWLRVLVSKLKSDESIGAIGGKILYGNSTKIWSTGAKVYFPGFVKHLRLMRGREVDYTPFAAILIRAGLIMEEGLDERLVMYSEDAELCKRIKLKGFRVLYEPKAIAYHDIPEHRISKHEEFFIQRNRPYYYAKYYGWFGKRLFLLFDLLLFFPLFAFYRILKNPKRLKFLKEMIKARIESIKLILS
jgi:GT2 family glycosyltransferase